MKKNLAKIKSYIKKSKGIVLTAVMCLVAIILSCSFFAYAVGYAKILPNIRVEDIKIGGMTIEEADRELKSEISIYDEDRLIVLECDGKEQTINLKDFKASVDNKKTIENAFSVGRNGGSFKKAFRLFKLAFKGEKVPLEISIDEELLDNVLSELAKDKEIPAVETYYQLDGDNLTIIKGHGGKMIDRRQAAKKVAEAALDKSIRKLNFEIETIKEEKVDLERLYAEITAPMKNAEYKLEDGQVVIVPEKIGVTVEKDLVKEALDSYEAEYTLTVETEEPEVTAKKLEELLFRDVMGTWSSNFATSTEARAGNVILTANRINNKILMPGDVFSYDKTIGKRTAANGFREAGVYIGNKVESGIGGGICQTSSTLYSAALYANLEIVSRTSHSLPVSYMPAGQDATIAEGYIDLKIKNNTEYPIKILAQVDGRRLTCSILGVKDPDIKVEIIHTRTANYEPEVERSENPEIPKGYKYIANKGAGGYAVSSQRVVKKAGETVKTEKLTRSVYRAAPIEEQVNPADKDTPSEQLRIYTPGMVINEKEQEPAKEDSANQIDETKNEQEVLPEEDTTEGNAEDKTEENTI